ncbi:NAD(P)H-binding protein [Mycobacterium sp.]|uniref:NAD(P)H-binding protein n=1 Tax=Mycobacterium sp. TaxID=1785 RepID=UPI003D11AAE2
MSSAPTTLVTSAAGKTGRQVAASLLARGLPVRALVRREDARAAALRGGGAEVVVGNIADVTDVRRALHGVQRAYWAAPITPLALELATIFATVAEEQHLEVVVSLSQWLADPAHPSAHTRAEWLSDQVFSWMPTVGSITVNPGFFAENYLYTLDAVAQFGMLTAPYGDGRNAPPSNEDIAAVAAALLADPGPHMGRTYRPTGPTLLNAGEFAEILSRIFGRRIRYVDVPFPIMAKAARVTGFNEYTVMQLKWYVEELKRGTFAVGAPTDAVQTLTGRPPEDMETIARRYLASTPGTTRSPAGMARAMTVLTKTILTAAPNEKRYLAAYQDGAAYGTLSADSEQWRATHDPTRRLRPIPPRRAPTGTEQAR